MKMPDHLMLVYEQLQTKINEIVTTENVDDRTRIAFHTFLFTIKYATASILSIFQANKRVKVIEPRTLSHSYDSPDWRITSFQFAKPGAIQCSLNL